MDIVTDGDQVAAHYAAGYAGLFTVIKNGAPHRAPAAGDVLSLPAGLALSAAGVLSGTPRAEAAAGTPSGPGTIRATEAGSAPKRRASQN
jgi:hypothetical protein